MHKRCNRQTKGHFFQPFFNSCVFYGDTLHPLTCKKIYKSVVIPKALYGCEIRSALSSDESLTVERAHRFCFICMQSLGVRTRTDIALGLLKMFPIETEIEFGQLCRLSSDFWVKTMSLNKVMSYRINPSKQTGFIVEIEKILQKYELGHILYTYIQDGVLPGKFAWKRMIKAKVHEAAKSDGYNRISIPEIHSFKLLHGQFVTHWLWLFSKDNRRLLKPCTSVVQLIYCVSSLPHISSSCNKCQCDFTNLADHCIHECTILTD